MENQSTVCRLCGSNSVVALYSGVPGFGIDRHFDILRCRTCGVGFTFPFLSEDEIQSYYLEQTTAYNGAGNDLLVDHYLEHRREYWTRLGYVERLQSIHRQCPKAVTILDVGCGTGFFLDCAAHRGLDAFGLELSEWGSSTATNRLGLRVRRGNLREMDIAEFPAFDVVTMYDVLEHSPDPRADLKVACALLRPGGLLVVNLPNLDSLLARVTGQYWLKLIPPNHLFHFNRSSLLALVNSSGIRVSRVATNNGASEELVGELLGSTWRLARRLPGILPAYAQRIKPLHLGKGLPFLTVKASMKLFYNLGVLGPLLKPLLTTLGLGEGLHLVGYKPK